MSRPPEDSPSTVAKLFGIERGVESPLPFPEHRLHLVPERLAQIIQQEDLTAGMTPDEARVMQRAMLGVGEAVKKALVRSLRESVTRGAGGHLELADSHTIVPVTGADAMIANGELPPEMARRAAELLEGTQDITSIKAAKGMSTQSEGPDAPTKDSYENMIRDYSLRPQFDALRGCFKEMDEMADEQVFEMVRTAKDAADFVADGDMEAAAGAFTMLLAQTGRLLKFMNMAPPRGEANFATVQREQTGVMVGMAVGEMMADVVKAKRAEIPPAEQSAFADRMMGLHSLYFKSSRGMGGRN